MAEETQQQPNEPTQNDAAELATLRTTVSELKTKSATRKHRIAELEAANAELQTQLTDASTALRQITIDRPLKQMSESISTCPELWIEQFNKSYRLEMVKGNLTLLTTDGKPVVKGDKPVEFDRESLIAFLTDEKHPQSKAFNAISITSRASGAAASPPGKPSAAPKPPAVPFGLR